MIRKPVSLLCACLLLSLPLGCIGKAKNKINNTMASWEGHHYSELLSSWGIPQSVMDDGSGGRVLVYTTTRSWTTPATATTTATARVTQYDNIIWGQGSSTTVYNPSQTYGYTAWRMFFITKEGTIYKWAWRGL